MYNISWTFATALIDNLGVVEGVVLYQLAHLALFSDMAYAPFITVKVVTLTCTCMQSVDLHVHVHVHVQYLYTVYGFIDNSGSELSVVPSHNAKQCYLLEHKLHCSHLLANVS